MPSSNCIASPRCARASPRRAPSLTRKRARPGSPATRYFSIPSHSSNQSAGPTCSPPLQRHGLGRLARERALVALERGARVAVLGGAEEEAQDLRHVVLVDAEIHEPPRILGLDGVDLRAAQPELARESLEVGQPALAQPRVAAYVEYHLIQRQGLVAALDATHRPIP